MVLLPLECAHRPEAAPATEDRLEAAAVDGDDVVRLDPAIVILIERQKRLSNRGEVARDLEADLGIEFLDTLFDLLHELFLLEVRLRRLNGAFVDDGVLPCKCHVREE